MKNKLTDLNNHLFTQMERLQDESLTGKELKAEIDRGRATATIAKEIVNNARLVLDAKEFTGKNRLQPNRDLPEIFDGPAIKPALLQGGKT